MEGSSEKSAIDKTHHVPSEGVKRIIIMKATIVTKVTIVIKVTIAIKAIIITKRTLPKRTSFHLILIKSIRYVFYKLEIHSDLEHNRGNTQINP